LREKILLLAFSILLLVPVSHNAFAASTPGETLYGVTGGDGDYEFWKLTDTVTEIEPSGDVTVSGIEFDTDGTLYVAGAANGGNALFGTIDPSDGSYTDIITGDAECTDIGIDPTDGTLYCQDQTLLYTINKITGVQSTSIGSTGLTGPGSTRGSAMDIAPDGTMYYGNGNGLYTLDKGDGSATSIASWQSEITDDDCLTNAFDFDNFGTLWASLNCDSGNYLVTVDKITAQITFVEETVDFLDGIAFTGGPDIPGVQVGGTLIPIDSVSLILSGAQLTVSWMIPVIVSALGIGLVFVRKSENS
jgi:hypothetical protein